RDTRHTSPHAPAAPSRPASRSTRPPGAVVRCGIDRIAGAPLSADARRAGHAARRRHRGGEAVLVTEAQRNGDGPDDPAVGIVGRMGKAEVLNRVAADLARGSTHRAIQRLSGLVAAYPTDLDLRRRLAAAYRRAGNRIQAGRWDYLTIGADRRDTAAFE